VESRTIASPAPRSRHPLRPAIRGRISRPPGWLVYGPLESRRLGRSLGINLARPGHTSCSFRCVYCEFPREECCDAYAEWPTPSAVGSALAGALSRCGRLDSITISGSGEPTEHPQLAAVVSQVMGEARRARPGVPVRILTNGATAVRPEVRRALGRLDERIVTLDAGAKEVDQPEARSPLGGVLYGISLLRSITVQSCFIDGAVSNVGDETVCEWADILGELRPQAVQVFTMSRRPAALDVRPVSVAQLDEIAGVLRERTGIEAQVFA